MNDFSNVNKNYYYIIVTTEPFNEWIFQCKQDEWPIRTDEPDSVTKRVSVSVCIYEGILSFFIIYTAKL